MTFIPLKDSAMPFLKGALLVASVDGSNWSTTLEENLTIFFRLPPHV